MPEQRDNILLAELRRYGRGSTIVLIGTVISSLMGLLFSIIMARAFNPETFGLVQLALATGMLIGGFLALGSSSAVTHFVARFRALGHTRAMRHVLMVATAVVSIAIFPLVLLYFLTPDFLPGIFFSSSFRITAVLASTILIAFLMPYYTIVMAALRGLEKYTFLQIWDGLLKRLLWIIPLFFLPAAVYLWTFPISLLVILIIAVIFLMRCIEKIPAADGAHTERARDDALQQQDQHQRDVDANGPGGRRCLRRQFLAYLLPLSLASIVGHTKGELNTVLLGLFSTEVQAGYFRIALSIGKILLLALGVANVAFLPMASKLLALDRKAELFLLYRTITKWLWILTVPASVFLIIFAPNILQSLYGQEYAAAESALILVVIGAAVNATFGPINNLILAFGRTKAKFIIEVATFIVVLGLNVLLIPVIGSLGAAVAFTAGFVFWNSALYVYLHIHEGSLRAIGLFHILYLIAVSLGMALMRWVGEKVLNINGHLLMAFCLAISIIPIAVVIMRLTTFQDDRSLLLNMFKRNAP